MVHSARSPTGRRFPFRPAAVLPRVRSQRVPSANRSIPGGRMSIESRTRWLCVALLMASAMVLGPSSARVDAQSRQISVETLVYDLKSPDALRRQVAARELGNIKYKTATPDLVSMTNDPVVAVRREVELALEHMQDLQALPGLLAFASDGENDIRARAVAALVDIHLSRETGFGAMLTKL